MLGRVAVAADRALVVAATVHGKRGAGPERRRLLLGRLLLDLGREVFDEVLRLADAGEEEAENALLGLNQAAVRAEWHELVRRADAPAAGEAAPHVEDGALLLVRFYEEGVETLRTPGAAAAEVSAELDAMAARLWRSRLALGAAFATTFGRRALGLAAAAAVLGRAAGCTSLAAAGVCISRSTRCRVCSYCASLPFRSAAAGASL